MRFLVDETTGPGVAEWLQRQGHEAFSVYDDAPGMEDDDIILKALDENWILVTNDQGLGEKVDRERRPHKGLVVLRPEDERTPIKIKTFKRLLDTYGDELSGRFVVVAEKKARFGQTGVLNTYNK